MKHHTGWSSMLVTVVNIIFGFDGQDLKLLLVKHGEEPLKSRWGLPGDSLLSSENFDQTAARIQQTLTGHEKIHREQLGVFGPSKRTAGERKAAVAFFSLMYIRREKLFPLHNGHPQWHSFHELPSLPADQRHILEAALQYIRCQSSAVPLLFRLLPPKFTIPQLQLLYETVHGHAFDKRNFSRKMLSTGLLVKQPDKEKLSSKRGAFYYKL
ncbi:DNA mismatch repair protein MutT [Chitinophaga varians]|uniref:DNA mismatch repair protein MutT n=1 Tax=Chitinophaga varians TaxID=2202339 RepID=A0A847R768_9BACT|nr:NUDIX domain-containing protein [Chitinophaga varians]NLR62959.1 DNA mismatch repair protein MutT [Chitinophaga varians]